MAKGKLCRSTAKGIGFVTLRQRNSGQMARAKESSTANSSGHGMGKVPSTARKVVRRQRERLRHCRAREKESSIDPRQIPSVTARQVCCCFRSVRSSGHTACDHKGKLRSNGKGKSSRRSTARETPGKWQGQRTACRSRLAATLSWHGKVKLPSRQRKVPAVQRQILPVTARKACCCFRSVRSSGHTACDGKACCRSLFIPTGGAGRLLPANHSTS